MPYITRAMMKAVEAFSVKISSIVMNAVIATILKPIGLAPFSSRSEDRINALKPTRLSFASSLGWNLMKPIDIQRPASFVFCPIASTAISRKSDRNMPMVQNNLK